jgi:hypothetical protein
MPDEPVLATADPAPPTWPSDEQLTALADYLIELVRQEESGLSGNADSPVVTPGCR